MLVTLKCLYLCAYNSQMVFFLLISMIFVARLFQQKYLDDDDELSRLRVLRWNKDGARQTAILVGVIWFSSTNATTSLRKKSRIFRTSRFSSGSRRIAAWTAQNCWSFGISKRERWANKWESLGAMVSSRYRLQINEFTFLLSSLPILLYLLL